MHIHAAQASALGNALAGAQDAETAMSLRRARELRDAAVRLKAASFEPIASLPADPDTAAQTVSMIAAWSGGGSAASQPGSQSGASVQERAAADVQLPNASTQTRQVQRTPPSGPVSYWA
jgi:hypothetical protein